MARILFVTIKVISGYQRKAQNKNNYSETKETLLLASTRNGQLPGVLSRGDSREPVYLPSGIW